MESDLRKQANQILNAIKNRINHKENYKHVTLCDEWKNDPDAFYAWYEANSVTGWQVDKDILGNGNGNGKIYSPEFCLFVPSDVNLAFRTFRKTKSGYKGVEVRGKKFRFLVRMKDKNHYGTVRTHAEHAYADYLMFRSEHLKNLSMKYSQLFEILQIESDKCYVEAQEIYKKYN